jgi:hypothetical protein
LIGKDEGVDLVVEDLEQFGERNGSINEETELRISLVLPWYWGIHCEGRSISRGNLELRCQLTSSLQISDAYSAGQSRPVTSTSSHRSRFGKQTKVGTTSSEP